MTTITLSGYQGQKHIRPGPADLYQCTPDFQVDTKKTASTTQTGRVFIARAPKGARWVGGYIHGLMTAETEYSMYSKTGNGGAPFHLENAEDFTIERLKVDGHCWDPIRPGAGVKNPTIDTCWVQDTRDDGIEADHTSVLGTLTVRRTFWDNTHTCISTKPGASGDPSPYRWVIEDCLMSLANNHRDSRDKRKYAWNPTNYGSGPFWKTKSDGKNGKILLRNSVMMARRLPKQALSNHRLIERFMEIEPGTEGNIFIWLGPQTKEGNGGVGVVAVPRIGGGTIMIPESFLGPTSERRRILDAFEFTDDEGYWQDAEKTWMTTVWGQKPPAPPPAPGPDPTPIVVMRAAVAGLQDGQAVLEAELPHGNLSRAARNTGAKHSANLVAACQGMTAAKGEHPAFDKMKFLGEASAARAERLATALGADNGQAALEAATPELTDAIVAQVPLVEAAYDDEPEPEPEDPCAELRAENAELLDAIADFQEAFEKIYDIVGGARA